MRSDELKPEIDPALSGIAEEMKESGGHWQPCSGCYDTEDGHPTAKYPYSPALQTSVGSGCHECGGLGAVWWHMSEQDIADYEKICEDVDTEVRITTRVARLEFALRGLSKAYAACNGEDHPAYEDAQRALADALSAQVKDVASSGGMEFPEALTDDLRDVLSTMIWTSGQIAACLRAGGDQIKTRAEDEQAHVLHWLISLALKHGPEWRAKASERIKAIRDAAAPAKQER